jgi:hypothetical protein
LAGCGSDNGSPGDGGGGAGGSGGAGGMGGAGGNGGAGGSGDMGGSSPLSMLPDTSNGIFVFADQLAGGYSAAVLKFAATHFAGTQKMLKADNDAFRAINPNWLLLHYRLGSSSGPVQYIHSDTWSSDFATDVDPHEDWFMHNMNNQRHYESTDMWYINDISNAGFRSYWVTSVIADMRATGAQGVFADSFEAGISGYGVTDPDPRFDGTNPANPTYWANGDTWINQKKEYIDYLVNAFSQTTERFLFVPNIGAMITGWGPTSTIPPSTAPCWRASAGTRPRAIGCSAAIGRSSSPRPANSSSCSRIPIRAGRDWSPTVTFCWPPIC